MSTTTKKILENKIRQIVNEVMAEADGAYISPNQAKSVLQYVNMLGKLPTMQLITNDKKLIQITDQISRLRMDMVEYIEQNSQYKFVASGPNSWRLTKK
jgi:predicted methyltransferase